MRAVDTNVLVRLLTRDDAKQVAAAEAFVRPGAWVSHIALVETMWVLSSVYAVKPKQIAVAIEMLLAHENLAVQEPDVVASALDNFRARPAGGFSDCLILAIAHRAGHLPLGTVDKDLGKLEGAQRL